MLDRDVPTIGNERPRALKLKSRRQQQVLLPALLLPGGLRLPNGLRRGNSYFIDSIRAMDL
jgi:hypothetical protein